MPRTKRLHGLKRPKLRQDWSKWNLYNLSRIRTPPAANKTFFQQKWTAKSMLRSYHNPDVREGTWTRMFDRRLPAVVPMDHRYLAQHDGSDLARGTGSGIESAEKEGKGSGVPKKIEKTSYMHMTFWPLERRLDTAIHRALFASSVRQARQMVVHGFVKVNGKKMIYPGYQLNPGDLFSVDPERVMYSTGAQKRKKDDPSAWSDKQRDREARQAQNAEARARSLEEDTFDEYASVEVEVTKREPKSKTQSEGEAEGQNEEAAEAEAAVEAGRITTKSSLKNLLKRAKSILEDSKGKLSGKRLQELRDFTQDVRKAFSQIRGIEESQLETTVDSFQTSLSDILAKVPSDAIPPASAASTPANTATTNTPETSETSQTTHVSSNPQSTPTTRARKDAELLHAALERARLNPVDTSKPYATPWRPRDYMSAFAFIPRYLEVNQRICSAVYLRHPVARPGLSEVPTPFSGETMGLGFNWYLRRR